jgi:hypothetical protein
VALFTGAVIIYIEPEPVAGWARLEGSVRFYHCTFARGERMTTVEIMFRYGMPPAEAQMSALGQVSDVYGIRRVQFNEQERTIRVEYDATRLNEATVEGLLRTAGFDVRERLAMV